jgi:glycosyltransferase involved in cell wall biosynthesis
MKILHICALGGTAKSLLKPQIDYLLSRNLSVEIACSIDPYFEKLQQQGYAIHPIPIDRKISPVLNIKSIYALVNLIRKQQYDLVHVHTPIAAVLGRVAAKIAGVKRIVYTSHGLPFHDRSSPKEYTLYSNVEKFAALLTDLILSQNQEDIATAKKLGLCPPEKIAYLGNGVDIDRFKRDRLDSIHQTQLRKSLEIPDTADLIIGTIGRLTRKKGCGYLIEATAKLLPQFPNLHTIVIGSEVTGDPEPIKAEVMERIRTLGIEKHFTFTGSRQDISELLGLLDIFTLPTFSHEGLPRSILEAMAMSLPVVATDIRGCREAVIDGETGFIVPPQDSEKLAEALGRLLSDADFRQACGKAGRQRVETEYDENLVFDRLEQFYRKLGIKFS